MRSGPRGAQLSHPSLRESRIRRVRVCVRPRALYALPVVVASIAERDVTTCRTHDLRFIREACVTVAAIRRESARLDLLCNEPMLHASRDGAQILTSHQNVEQGHQALSRRVTRVY